MAENKQDEQIPALDPQTGAFVSAEMAAHAKDMAHKRRRSRRRALVVLAAFLVALLAVYLGGAAWYSSHFVANAKVGGHDVSNMDIEGAVSSLEDSEEDYTLAVSGEGLDFTVTSADTGLRFDEKTIIDNAMKGNDPWRWPIYLAGLSELDLSSAMQVTYDESKLADYVKAQVTNFNKDATEPVSAGIEYDKKSKGFEIVPEELGTKLNADAVLTKVETAASEMQTRVEIGEGELLQPDIVSGDERLATAQEEANKLIGADIQLTLDGLDWLELDATAIASWVAVDKDLNVSLDESALRDWAGNKTGKLNTVGAKRSFTTPGGTKVKVSGGSYGWKIDYEPFVTALIDAVNSHKNGELEVPYVQSAASIPDDDGVDFGKKYIEVDLEKQHATFYNGKKVLWESDFISGSPDGEHDTPTGVYCINNKESPSTLKGEMVPVEKTTGKGKKAKTTVTYEPEYETVVEFWMPFVGNGVGFHDATWQPGFGGTMYKEGYGSHGCINLPYDAAESLYKIVDKGVPVIVHK